MNIIAIAFRGKKWWGPMLEARNGDWSSAANQSNIKLHSKIEKGSGIQVSD